MTLENIQLASHNGSPISFAEVMATMKATGEISAVETALSQVIAKKYAAESNISASIAELQAAADEFRQLSGLQKTDDMKQWLEDGGQTLEEFESSLEHSILEDKLRKHLATNSEVERMYLAQRANLERVEIAQIAVSEEGQANEIFAQLAERELSFEDAVASYESEESAKRQNGYSGWFVINDLAPNIQSKFRNADDGDMIGPIKIGQTHVIFKVWSKEEPKLDDELREVFEEAIYADWLCQKLEESNIDLSFGQVQIQS
ncbi:MAG: peptidylprolyl isomerase [Rhizobiaceae bacterium]